ncbi:MAG TPA: glucose 1-dehydrogenase [Planctomycetota bacterium]|nr:glucose 1-dehydrogenase [Planctomycetota bacterium]
MNTDLFRLDGKVAILTGGGRGLGRAMAVALAEAGADCVLVARREADLAESVKAVAATGRRAVAVPGDVADEPTAIRAVQVALREFKRLDILVNCAGTYHMGPLEKTSVEDWRRVLDVNLVGSFLFCKAVGPTFLAQKSGKVVNIASVLGLVGAPNASAYCASKGGVMMLTRALAAEWAPHGLHVNCIAPGLFATDMSSGILENEEFYKAILAGIPRGRHGEPADLAGSIVYLCSRASDHMIGQTLHVDGGSSIV